MKSRGSSLRSLAIHLRHPRTGQAMTDPNESAAEEPEGFSEFLNEAAEAGMIKHSRPNPSMQRDPGRDRVLPSRFRRA